MEKGRNTFDCVIVGSGPGGLVAGIYLLRMLRQVLLIDGGPPRAERIPLIRNLIGYEDGISGRELIRRLRKQYAKYGGQTIKGRAVVKRVGKGFRVTVGKRNIFAEKVILATGMRDVEPHFRNTKELTAEGLLGYCPICDGYDHRAQKIALLVNEGADCKKVNFLSTFTDELVVIPMAKFKLSPATKKIIRERRAKFFPEIPLTVERSRRRGLDFNFPSGAKLYVDAAYVLMGAKIPSDATAGLRGLRKTREGFLRVDSHQETSIPGLFAVGDCVSALSQVSVAVGHAATAATQVHNSLRRAALKK